jgi:hypothetical protein
MLKLVGFIIFGLGAVCAVGYWYADRQLQAFRLPDKPRSAYWFVPIRIRPELYKPEGQHLVNLALGFIGATYVLAFIGMVLIALGS